MYRYIFSKVYKCRTCGGLIRGSSFSFCDPDYIEIDGKEMEGKLDFFSEEYNDRHKLHYCDNGFYSLCDFVGLQAMDIKGGKE